MADTAEDVLELDTELEIEDEDQTDGDVAQDDDEEIVIGFGDEGEAPSPAEETSTIRDLRERNRTMARELSELRKMVPTQKVELGPKPTLADFGYDEEAYDTANDEWKARKAEIESEQRTQNERIEAEQRAWNERVTAYEAEKAQIKGADEAEDVVAAALPETHMAAILRSGKAAQLIVALRNSPEKLDTLAKLDPTDATLMIGELRGKLQMGTRSNLKPERRVAGNAPVAGGTDKELARLKAKAEQTGDYSEYLAAKRQAA